MILNEYSLGDTKIKFHDDYIVKNISTQEEYINKIIINLMNKSFLL